MAVESKPLFHPEVLRQQVRSFSLPEQATAWQPKLQHWAELIRSGRADAFKESELLPDFLTDFFCGLLGYTGPVGANAVDSSNLPSASAASPSPPREERAGERRPFAREPIDPAALPPRLTGAYTLYSPPKASSTPSPTATPTTRIWSGTHPTAGRRLAA